MTIAAIAGALTGNRMVERFHADPRVQATELLLQERVPRHAALILPRPDEVTRVAAPVPPAAVRRFRSPHTAFPHAHFLSNGNYTAVVTNAGGGTSFCRGRAVTRWRQDATRDPGGQYLYLRDVRSGRVWSATHQPTAASTSTSATSAAGGSGPRRTSRPRATRTTTSSCSRWRRPPSSGGTTRSGRSSTSRSPPRTTSRCGGSR